MLQAKDECWMRIYDVNLSGTSASESGRAQELQRAGHEAGASLESAGGASSDQVSLSHALNSLANALSTDGGSRATKVQALAAQYRSGTYRVDSLATSRGIVSEALVQKGG
jgi:anti-sigma28 factor (negative regulator of flagellin synthesis)